MKKVILFGLLLCMGVATASGQKSNIQVFGVQFGSTYEEFLSAFKDKEFTGDTQTYENAEGVDIYNIFGTFMGYKCAIKMWATRLTHTVYKMTISFSLNNDKDMPALEYCRAIIAKFEEKYGKATLIQKMHGSKVVQDLEESSAAVWKLEDNIDLEVFYRGFDSYKVTYGGTEAFDGLFQKEADQYRQQKALEIQNQMSNSDF